MLETYGHHGGLEAQRRHRAAAQLNDYRVYLRLWVTRATIAVR